MKSFVFAKRNFKEILRDPLSLMFSICLPVFLLLMISFVQKSAKVDIFKIENFAPAIILFSFSFLMLFLGILIAKDRSNFFLIRLYASPLKSINYLIGYSIPLLFIAIIQIVLCYGISALLGMSLSINILYSLLIMIPVAILFIALGLLLGCSFSDKQVGGVSSVVINIAAFTSGMWFDFSLMSGAFKTVSYLFPFAHALDATKMVLQGNYNGILTDLVWVIGYTILIMVIAVIIFKKNMKKD